MEEMPLDLIRRFAQPGIHQLLAGAVKRGLRLGIFSDYPASSKLDALGVLGYFHCVRHAQQSDVGEFKPSPKGIKLTLESLEVSPKEAVYVGDRPEIDGEAARRAGVSALILGKPSGASGDGWIGVPDIRELQLLLAVEDGN
jgi:phosphoglycolate phosphatase-like HAD superfamily hydrolase